ncbi:alpha/beta fold hydrolase [Streptomyces sp. NPDC054841]
MTDEVVGRPWPRRPDRPAGPPKAVLLHGLGGRSAVWDRFVEEMTDPIGLRAVELPWRTLGDPGWSHTGEPGRAVTDAVGTADVVVAHSYSANLLLEEYASGRLAPRPTVLMSPFYRSSPGDFDWTTISFYLNEFHQTFLEALRLGDTGRYPEAHRVWMAGRLRDHIGPYGWMRFFTSYLHTPFLDLDVIEAPVLVLTGAADIAARPDDGRALAAALPDGRYVQVDGCGHFPMLERPALMARTVSDFLGAVRRPGGARHRAPTKPHPGADVNPTPSRTSQAPVSDAEASTTVEIRPRYEGSNICTWIGFKHVNYVVEEAVLDHLRQRGFPAGMLYERYGLCVDITDLSTKIMTAYHIDDIASATVRQVPGKGPELRFAVELTVEREGKPVKAAGAKVAVSFRLDPRGGEAEPAPAELAPHVVDRLGTGAEPIPVTGEPLDQLISGSNAFAWAWRMPYFYCHFTERVQMSGYLRQMEEVLDLFLEDRGVSIKRLLDEQDWIPVVPKSRITILDEAKMEEELYTVFTVEDVFKRFTFTARMDCYVQRDGKLIKTATGRITHGWAVIDDNRRDWSVVNFDDRLTNALHGKGGTATGRGSSLG